MVNQLVFNKSELKKCGITVIQSIHSNKRHAYPKCQAVYVIDPLYREVYRCACSCESVEWRHLARFVHFRPGFTAQALRKRIDFAVSSLAKSDRREEDLGYGLKQTVRTSKTAFFFVRFDFHRR